MTSHDREFMNRIVTRIAEIDDGEITTYAGNYEFYERERAIRDANREAAYARQQAMLAKEQRFIDRFAAHAAKAAQVQAASRRSTRLKNSNCRRSENSSSSTSGSLRGRVTRPSFSRISARRKDLMWSMTACR